jgi:endoglucanase
MRRAGSGIILAVVWLATVPAGAAELVDVCPVTDSIIQLHFIDGHAVIVPRGGQGSDRIEESPLDLKRALDSRTWRIERRAVGGAAKVEHPVSVGRKSKGRDFIAETIPVYRQRWTNEHWIFLRLAMPLRRGTSGVLSAPALGITAQPLRFDPLTVRSEAVHVTQVGMAQDAAQKFAYVSAWLGTLGPCSLDAYRGAAWWLVDQATGATVFAGSLAIRKRVADGPDGGQPNEGPHFGADVWQCDFSAFRVPGRYVVAVDRIGCSFPFTIGPDAYREAFRMAMHGLYQQRCGTALTAPYTAWTRSACHVPEQRPTIQSTRRLMDGHCDACDDPRPTGEVRDIRGGYHDAGDWDREGGHLDVPLVLAEVYELFPAQFTDGELNIPESGNGLPDILDEAQWGLDYYRRLQRPDGGVSGGMFVDHFPQPGLNAAMDTASRFCYAEDPQMSYRYAAAACHFAFAVTAAGKPALGEPYVASARRAWDWAGSHQRPGDAKLVADDRITAAAALFRATGDPVFHQAFVRDLMVATADTDLWVNDRYDQQWAAWTYARTERPGVDGALRARLRQAALHFARTYIVDTAARRAGRYGANWWRPLTWGFGAAPETQPALEALALTGDPAYRTVMQTTADFALGGNPLNTCWITGAGSRPPEGVFHPDSWYGAQGGRVCPGIVPEGPYRYEGEPAKNSGFWDPKFVMASAVPPAKGWPPMELYFAARTCFPMNEFTVAQIARAAAAYGALCAPANP